MKPFNPEDLAYRPENEKKKKRLKLPRVSKPSKWWVLFVSIVLLLTGGAFAGKYFYLDRSAPVATPDQIEQKKVEEAKKKTQEILGIVDKQIKLPTDEEPIMATVSDRNELQDQDFFKDAQNGDKILMYPQNKKAYLYRPSTKQVLATAPLDYQVGKGDTNASSSAEPLTPTIQP